jgi:hypothetical protein
MNALLFFCAFMAFFYLPWDFLVKPMASDEEVWFGVRFHGFWAKLLELPHWAVYAAGAVGFWQMRRWMWPWAALYAAQVALGFVVALYGRLRELGAGGSEAAFGAPRRALQARARSSAGGRLASAASGVCTAPGGHRRFARASRARASCVLTARRDRLV